MDEISRDGLLAIITAQGKRLTELDELRTGYLLQQKIHDNNDASLSERLVAGREMVKIAKQMLDAILAWYTE